MTLTPHPHRSSSAQYSGGFSCTVISRAASGGCGSQRVSFAGEEEEQVPSEAENLAQEDAPLVTNLRKGIWPKRPEVRISIAVQTYRVLQLSFPLSCLYSFLSPYLWLSSYPVLLISPPHILKTPAHTHRQHRSVHSVRSPCAHFFSLTRPCSPFLHTTTGACIHSQQYRTARSAMQI